ncbi:hypothetical protein GS492_15325 [Rhodococcus hoagii]|nr:hypothetical protein [Prescottella equi]
MTSGVPGLLNSSLRNVRIAALPTLLAVFILASTFWNSSAKLAFYNSATFFALFLCGSIAANKMSFDSLLRATSASLKLLILVSWLAIAIGAPAATGRGADGSLITRGIFVHSNLFATVCALALVTLAVEWVIRPQSRKFTAVWIAVAGVTLWVTDSRTGQVTLAAAVLVVLAVEWVKKRNSRYRSVAVGVAGALGLAALVAENLSLSSLSMAMGRSADLTGRTEIWSATLREVERSPWLGGGFLTVWRDDSPVALRIRSSLGFRAAHAHNGYLDILLQLGIVGLVMFSALVFLLIWRSYRSYLRERTVYFVWPIAIGIALAVSNLSESRFTFAVAWLLMVTLYTKVLLLEPTKSRAAVEECVVAGGASYTRQPVALQPSAPLADKKGL